MGIVYKATFHRNGLIRNIECNGENILDVEKGEVTKGNYNSFKAMCDDMKRQGFRPLPYDPTQVVLTPEAKENFTKTYGYEF